MKVDNNRYHDQHNNRKNGIIIKNYIQSPASRFARMNFVIIYLLIGMTFVF